MTIYSLPIQIVYNILVSKHSKGTRYELEARKILEKEGYLVEKKNYNRWASKDFYNLFDILALGNNETKFIQVKTNISDFYSARKKIKEWLIEYPKFNIICEVWLKEPRKEWRREKVLSI